MGRGQVFVGQIGQRAMGVVGQRGEEGASDLDAVLGVAQDHLAPVGGIGLATQMAQAIMRSTR